MSRSLAADAQALALLRELLDTDAAEQAARLRELERTDAALHDRVAKLLRAATDEGATQGLASVMAAPLRQTGAPNSGDTIAGYRLLRELGRGGMATVWLAERADGSLKREVALKLPLALGNAGVLVERFARERDVLAALDHEHIARLYDAGVDAGQAFIVLEAVRGEPITEYAQRQALGQRERLRLFLQVLAAVDHAHRHMVVHRDLKPSNILVNDQGQAKLLDFGIAKLLDAPPGSADLTQEAGAALTPRYAAPEQLLGEPVTAATDVYAAGVVLHELLTGRLPHASPDSGAPPPSLADWVQRVTRQPLRAPGLGLDLDTVLMTALQATPAQRYASIERFADDLQRVLDHRPILARPVPLWRRAGLLLRRHARASVATAAALVVLAAAGALAWQQGRETAAQRQRADAVRSFVFAMVADAEPAQGQSDVTGREIVAAAVERARRELQDEPRLRGELLAELGRVSFRLNQIDTSMRVLEESLALLQRHAPPDDAALNRTRAVLARALIGRDAGRASQLATQALAGCTPDDAACAEARAHARYALTALASWQGRHADALQQARAMVEETARAVGADHPSMAQAHETLAGAARNAGELREAAAAVERAWTVGGREPMKAANRDRLDLLQALIDLDLGRHAAARERLQGLLQRPATDLERSTQWRMLAGAELGLGRPGPALDAAARALQRSPAGAARAYARQAWAIAATQNGRHDEAQAALEQVRLDLLAAGFADTSTAVLRLRHLAARNWLRQGRGDAALALLDAGAEREADLPPPDRAQFAEARGCALALLGRGAEARSAYRSADALRAALQPPEHPERLRLSALVALLEGSDAAADALASVSAGWAADSAWRTAALRDCRALM